MRVTPSQLRANIYRLIDQVVETGQPLEILRRGQVLRLVPPQGTPWIDRLPLREGVIAGDPEELVHVDWSGEWSPEPR